MNNTSMPQQASPAEQKTKNKLHTDITQLKQAVETATVEHVDTPSGRKDVHVVYQSSHGFEIMDGRAIGVYVEPSRERPERVHIDWADQHDRTTLEWDNIEEYNESDWYFPNTD